MTKLDDGYDERLSLLEKRVAALEQNSASPGQPKSRAIELGLLFATISIAVVFALSAMD